MTWISISQLAELTGTSTRTVRKRCEGLKCRAGEKNAKLYDSRQALPLINRADEHLRNPTPDRNLDLFIEEFKRMIGHKLFPGIIASKAFGAIIVNGCCNELGLDKAQGLRIYQYATMALIYALCELHEDDDMTFTIPDHMKDLGDLGPEAYLEKYAGCY